MIGKKRVLVVLMTLTAAPHMPELGTERAEARAQPADASAHQSRSRPTPVVLGSNWGIVTSVRRSPERNRAVGGAEKSYHLSGRAIDIARRPGVRHADIDAAYRKAGYILIESLDEGDHSHFAFRLPGDPEPPVRTAAVTSEEVAPAKCDASQASLGRRRPDRTDDCAAAPPTPPRLRPIEQTAP